MRQFWARRRIQCMVLTLTLVIDALGLGTVQAAPDDVEQAPVQNAINRGFFMDDSNFEANVFQPSGSAKQARIQTETRLKLQLDELSRVCELTDAQKQKLRLAAGMDIKRVFDEFEVIRKKFKDGKHDQEAWQTAWQEVQPLQQRLSSGLFGDTSFFNKAIKKTLSEDQASRYEQIVTERRNYRYHAVVEATLVTVENSVALLSSQHEAIVQLVITETRPPLAFGQYDHNYVMYQLGRLPEAKLKSLVDERQWNLLQAQLNGNRGMEQILVQAGVMPKEEAEIKIIKALRRLIPPAAGPANALEPVNRPRRVTDL